MNILFFNWRDITHPQAGGCELHLHQIAKRMVKKGHKVTLFCGSYPNSKSFENIDGISIIRKGGKYTVYIYAFFEYLMNLRKKNFDYIIDDINGIAFFTPLYVRKTKISILHHMVKDIFSKELPIFLSPLGYFAEWLIPFIYKNIEFITVSESSKEEMVQAGIKKENISVIYNGISSEYQPDFNQKTKAPSILYLGRLKAYKQIDHLIIALDQLVDDIDGIELSIAGSGEYEDDLKKMAKEHNLDNHITFHGFIDDKEKVELFQKSWVFVNPSIKEGWGLTVIEANACGTPAIAYDVPGLRESIKDGYNGLLVKSNRIDDLSNAIEKVIENKNLRDNLSYNAISWSKNFNWDKATIEFIHVLENVYKNK